MAQTTPASTARCDVWTWAVRVYPTRSVASAACKAGHVKVNGANAKPAHPLRPGDVVRARTPTGERILLVTALLSRRVSASVAAQHYEDRTPAPPPKEDRPAPVLRERGAGRPTKRDRRQVERLRGRG